MSNILKKFKTWFNRTKTTPASYLSQGVRPRRDWAIILSTVFFVVSIMAVLAVYFYVQISKRQFFVVIVENNTSSETIINKNLLRKIIDEMNRNEILFQTLKQKKAIPSDPSL